MSGEEKDKKKITDNIDLDVTYTSEQVVDNGTIDKIHFSSGSKLLVTEISLGDKDYKYSALYDMSCEGQTSEGMNLYSDMKSMYESTQSSVQTYDYLKTYIMEHKDNPQALSNGINSVLGKFLQHYDYDQNFENVVVNPTEFLDKFMNLGEGEQLDGLICGPIHAFAMQALHECGVEAALVSGINNSDVQGGNHVTLIYKTGDGQYVYHNYNSSKVIEASNIKDAVRVINKDSGDLSSAGYVSIQDGKATFQEFAFKKEAMFGDEMDKRDYNHQNPFGNRPASESGISGNVDISNLGNVSAEAGVALVDNKGNVQKSTELSVGYKKTGVSDNFDNSFSLGVKADYNSIKTLNLGNTLNTSFKGVASYTSGSNNGVKGLKTVKYTKDLESNYQYLRDTMLLNHTESEVDAVLDPNLYPTEFTQQELQVVSNPIEKNYVSTFFKGDIGYSSNLYQNDGISLTNSAQGSLMGGVTSDLGTGIGGDMRIMAQDGLQFTTSGSNLRTQTDVSAGVYGDFNLGIDNKPTLSSGVKLNAGTRFDYNPAENFSIGGSVSGYTTSSSAAQEWGTSASLGASYRPQSSKTLLFGSVGMSTEQQRINVGGFKDKTENNKTYTATVGAKINPNTTVSLSYNKYNDALNNTRNYSSVNLGFKMNF